MKKYFVLLFLLAALPLFANESKQTEIDFTGSLKPGHTYLYRVRSNQTRNCELKLLGVAQPPLRRDVREILLSGKLYYRGEQRTGKEISTEYEFEIFSLQATVNGVRKDFPELTGRTVLVSRKNNKTEYRFRQTLTGTELADAVMGGPAIPKADGKMEAEALALFRTVFAPGNDPIMNYMGAKRKMEQGKHLPMDITPILAALHQREIPAHKSTVDSFAEYSGVTILEGLPVHRVNLLAQGNGIPGYDFKFETSVMIPVKAEDAVHGPVRISRRVMEVVSTLLPEDNPFFSGATLETVSNDMTDLTIQRQKK